MMNNRFTMSALLLLLFTTNPAFGDQAVKYLASASFVTPVIETQNLKITTGLGTLYNKFYKKSWLMHIPGRSNITAHFCIDKDIKTSNKLTLVHLTSSKGSRRGYSPVKIVINGKVFKSKYDPVSMDYKTDTWDISKFLQDGNNELVISLLAGAKTNYWIRSLKIEN
jgi:hypothetical protein